MGTTLTLLLYSHYTASGGAPVGLERREAATVYIHIITV